MKNIIYFIGICLLALNISCNDDDSLPVVTPQATGTMTDKEGHTYGWARYNGLDWMTSNFRGGEPFYDLSSPDPWGDLNYYVDSDSEREEIIANFETYGNLLTWEDAIANAPEGWRLPTDEDWKSLERALGMSESDTNVKGWRGSHEGELIQQDSIGSGINLTLSGFVSMDPASTNSVKFRNAYELGYYWTATVDSSYTTTPAVWYRGIRANDPQIERQVTTTTEASDNLEIASYRYFSVRYVRDAQ